jgi:hypothetical protein
MYSCFQYLWLDVQISNITVNQKIKLMKIFFLCLKPLDYLELIQYSINYNKKCVYIQILFFIYYFTCILDALILNLYTFFSAYIYHYFFFVKFYTSTVNNDALLNKLCLLNVINYYFQKYHLIKKCLKKLVGYV